jgi:hypothetical protein
MASNAPMTREQRVALAKSGVTTLPGFSVIKASLTVELERQAYYPGSIVRGTAVFEVRKPTKIFAIRLRIAGKECMVIRMRKNGADIHTRQRETFWKQLVTLEGTTKTRQTAIGLKEKYREQHLKDAEKKKGHVSAGSDTMTVEPGTYRYPFAFHLPYGLPPSFEEVGEQEDYAAVVYYVKAYIDIPGGGDADLIGRTFFRVVSRISFDQWKNEALPMVDRRRHKITACCLNKGRVEVAVEVPRRVLSVAEDRTVPFKLAIDNTKSKEPVERVVVELVHLLTVRAQTHTETRRTVAATLVIEQTIESGKEGTVEGSLRMPPDIPPSLYGVLFSSEYLFNIEYDVPYADDPSSSIPITIVQRCETLEDVPIMRIHQSPEMRRAALKAAAAAREEYAKNHGMKKRTKTMRIQSLKAGGKDEEVEEEDDSAKHPLHSTRPYELAVGLHEHAYTCPENRMQDLALINATSSISLKGRMADRLLDEDEEGVTLNAVTIDEEHQARQIPDAKLWKCKVPSQYW